MIKIRDTIDKTDYPMQAGMSKEYANTIFIRQLNKNGVNFSRLKDIDIWFSKEDGQYKLSANKQND